MVSSQGKRNSGVFTTLGKADRMADKLCSRWLKTSVSRSRVNRIVKTVITVAKEDMPAHLAC